MPVPSLCEPADTYFSPRWFFDGVTESTVT